MRMISAFLDDFGLLARNFRVVDDDVRRRIPANAHDRRRQLIAFALLLATYDDQARFGAACFSELAEQRVLLGDDKGGVAAVGQGVCSRAIGSS